jgi:hypothetical protein
LSYTRVFSSASEPAPGRIHRRSQRPSEPFMSSLNHFGEYPQRSLSYHSMLNFFRLSGSPMKTKRDSQIRFHPIRDQHGWSRIRTCEGSATRFTVWPLWPLGYPPAWCQVSVISTGAPKPTPYLAKRNFLETLPTIGSQSWRRDSNSQPSVYKTDALPIELRQQPGP